MSTKLPRPEVNVTGTGPFVDVVISRDGKAQSIRGSGSNEVERTADVVKQLINDPRSAEWLP